MTRAEPQHVESGRRSVLVTGASRGIGRALCQEALHRGFEVHALVRQADQAPPGTHAHMGDLRDRAAIKALMKELAPRLDWYLANAGVSANLNPKYADTADKAADILDINATATIHSIYALAHEWIQLGARGKRIGVVSSLAASMGLPRTAVYSASKAALLIACQGLEVDLDRNGIAITAIQPGFIETDMSAGLPNRPFLISAEQAAQEIFHGMERGRRHIAFPASAARMMWLTRQLPEFIRRRTVRYMEKNKLL